ncbi:MAG: class IV adenylate cyclase [Acidobacteriota bacterium]
MPQIEAEIKLVGKTFDELQQRLIAAGFTLELMTPRHFEDNWLFDTPTRSLLTTHQALRVRLRDDLPQATLTHKGPPTETASSETSDRQMKVREEIELTVSDGRALMRLLEKLGFEKVFRYQKFRTIYRLAHPNGLTLWAMFDETPIGWFLELEGDQATIERLVAQLGLGPGDYLTEAYPRLQAERCRAAGRPLEDMTFALTSGNGR